ncbi:hypothetical protein V8E51_015634 [Hyaloscypha variabilis]
MRLLKRDGAGQLSLTGDLAGDSIPPYAILSHTWGAVIEEVVLQDLMNNTGKDKPGYKKISFCGERANTCYIDKTNSTELVEAINSMFRWYRNSTKCYVYLLDSWELAFRRKLIAPRTVEFFCSNGKRIGDRVLLERLVHEITRIAVVALRRSDNLSTFSEWERLSWAISRQTTKEEDKVYSLLGLFDVNMPLFYGEGEVKARDRLLEEVRRHKKKRHRDELSQVSFEFNKRMKTSASQCSSISSSRDLGILDPEPLRYSENSVHGLYFDKIDERLTGLTAAQQGTCRYQHADHSGFLWIKGNPGTGKSILIKFLFEKATSNTNGDPSQVTLSFFFLARGIIEEKSTTGLYRSLLYQLLNKVVELKESLDWITADALKQTLIRAIEKLGNECNQNRHYPTLDIEKGIKYIKSKLRLDKSKQAESLRSISIKKLRERLKEIPLKLADFWILFATRPLTSQELYFAIYSLKGLAEVKRTTSEVQLIHESWSGASGNFVEIPDPLLLASKAAHLRDTIRLRFPFLEYSNKIEQQEFLAEFPLQRWILLNNTLEINLIYVFVEMNLANLIRIHPQSASCFDVEKERYGLPIIAALVNGNYEAIQKFLEVQAEIHPQENKLYHLCRQYSENRNSRIEIGRNFTFSKERRSVCSYFAENGDEVVLAFLCALGKLDVKSTDRFGRTSLSYAAQSGCEGVVTLLLDQGTELETKDRLSRTPLIWATQRGREAAVKLLLDRGAELETRNRYGQTPLLLATISHGFCEPGPRKKG